MKIISEVKIGYKTYKVNMKDGALVDGNVVCYGNIQYDEKFENILEVINDD